ncbi:MAG TPA: hypothetical protein PL105_06905 [Caldilineaceae bacterium]|nr:hypothetical protein [Caldilineaceae bacterium]
MIKRLLQKEQQRREAAYRYRPHHRQQALAEVANALAALDRLAHPPAQTTVTYWQDKFDI